MSQASRDEQEEMIRADNSFLKMKLMLERGASFAASSQSASVPPDVENRFLRDVIRFESLNEGKPFIPVRDKIGEPMLFANEKEVAEADILDAWKRVLAYLNRHQITIGVGRNNVTPRQLYRFATEILPDLHVSSVNMPGLVHGFIYDEFYPDPLYDNPGTAVAAAIEPIFSTRRLSVLHCFQTDGLQLNDHHGLTQQQFINLVNHFKARYSMLDDLRLSAVECQLEEEWCLVRGMYRITGRTDGHTSVMEEHWQVGMRQHRPEGAWEIISVQLGGITF